MFTPKLNILPEPQRRLWPELKDTPAIFTLYGGTAIALRLGHRFSVDFDFFSGEPFVPGAIYSTVPYLAEGRQLQSAANTLTVGIQRGGPVQVSFFGGLSLGQVEANDTVAGPAFPVASLVDLGGMKAAVVTQRAELKDYLDIHALLTQAGIPLEVMLAAAGIIYGKEFNPILSLKALSYHGDPALSELSDGMRKDIIAAVRLVDVNALPVLNPVRRRREREGKQ